MWWRLPLESKMQWTKETDSEINSLFNDSFRRDLSLSDPAIEPVLVNESKEHMIENPSV